MDGPAFWICAALAAIAVGMGKGGMPVVGMLSVPILSLTISPVVAAGLLLPVYVVSDMFGLWAYRHAFNKRVLAIMLPGAVVGVGLGWATASIVSEDWVTMLVGVIGTSFALNLILRRKVNLEPRQAKIAPGVFWGMAAGLTSFVSHSGGPPYQIYTRPLNMPKMVFAGTSTIAFAVINAAKLVPYYFLGQFSSENLHIAMMLMPVAAVAVFIGVRLVRILPEVLFFRLITWTLLAVSLRLIWTGAMAVL